MNYLEIVGLAAYLIGNTGFIGYNIAEACSMHKLGKMNKESSKKLKEVLEKIDDSYCSLETEHKRGLLAREALKITEEMQGRTRAYRSRLPLTKIFRKEELMMLRYSHYVLSEIAAGSTASA